MIQPAYKINHVARVIIANQYHRYRMARQTHGCCTEAFGDNMQDPSVSATHDVKLEAWIAMQASIQIASGD